jgi:hypothetical protein
MTQLAPIKLEPKTPFEAGYKAYIETAMRLVEHELARVKCHYSVETNIAIEQLSAIKCGLQIAIDNMNRDYSIDQKDIEILEARKEIIVSKTRYSFGSKTD